MLAPTSRRMESRSGDVSQIAVEQAPEGARLSVARADELVMQLVADHADSLLRVARRYSLCADDAHDAYQRGMEILLRHARRLDPDRASGWIHTVVKPHIGTRVVSGHPSEELAGGYLARFLQVSICLVESAATVLSPRPRLWPPWRALGS